MSKDWTIACESGDWFPTEADYSQIASTEENARLMAASPKMLAILKAYVRECIAQDIKLGSITGDAKDIIKWVEQQ